MEVASIKVARAYRRAKDAHRVKAESPPPALGGAQVPLGSRYLAVIRTMYLQGRGFITKVLYDKHFRGRNFAKFNNAEIDTTSTCKLCCSAKDGRQYILRECSDPAMMLYRMSQETALHRKVCTAKRKRDPIARLYRDYYNLAVKRRPDTHEFWIGVY